MDVITGFSINDAMISSLLSMFSVIIRESVICRFCDKKNRDTMEIRPYNRACMASVTDQAGHGKKHQDCLDKINRPDKK